MRSPDMERLDPLTGHWRTTMRDAWFLEPAGREVPGRASGEWMGDAFVVFTWTMDGDVGAATSQMELVVGRSDANDSYLALYHDERGTCRVYDMTFGAGRWSLLREDPDMFQRFTASVGPDHIIGKWEASDDRGATWRKDFDLVFERVDQPGG
jgi:hypothetical protein